jgi:hypothetical protein
VAERRWLRRVLIALAAILAPVLPAFGQEAKDLDPAPQPPIVKQKTVQAKGGDMEMTVTFPEKCFSGHGMMLDIAVKNTGKKIIVWQSTGMSPYAFTVERQRGEFYLPVPLTAHGKTVSPVRREEAGTSKKSITQLLGPAGGFSYTVNLGRLYDLSLTGKYRFSLEWDLRDGVNKVKVPAQDFQVEEPSPWPFSVPAATYKERTELKPDLAATAAVMLDAAEEVMSRHAAMLLLERWQYDELTGKLALILDDSKVSVELRVLCVEVLERRAQTDKKVGDKAQAALAALRKRLRDADEPVRVAAIEALGRLADEASRAAFEEAAKSRSAPVWNAGKAAIESLDKAAKPDAKMPG